MGSTLRERFIQDAVAERLNGQYYRRRPAYVNTEVYTRLRRADVLLAFMRAPGRPYVVVVEAKSRSTIHQLKLRTSAHRARWAGRVLSLLLIVGLLLLLGYEWYFNAWNTLLLLGLFVTGSVAITGLVTRLQLSFTQRIGAIEQLGRYPANESWIAVGNDTFAQSDEEATLRRQCRKHGVGLIVVNAAGKLTLREKPRPRHVFNDYLSRYGRRKDILAQIEQDPNYGPTPPERRQNRRRFLHIALLLALTGLLVLLGYERSYGPVVPDPFSHPRYRSPEVVIGSPSGTVGGEVFGPTVAPGLPLGPLPQITQAPDCAVEAGGRFVVVDAVLSRQEANRRLSVLRAAGLRGHELMWAGCIDEAAELLVVYTGRGYPNLARAEETARAYRELLTNLGVPVVVGRPGTLVQ
ncbi:hypothetical protein [Neolewinella sp.]|uniref:hypothetical protein n=1 Tax=Neolewinella sp. TaxID=2993543 RepID=UPI003B52BC94